MQGERSMVVLGLRLMDNFQTKKKKKNWSKIPSYTKVFWLEILSEFAFVSADCSQSQLCGKKFS